MSRLGTYGFEEGGTVSLNFPVTNGTPTIVSGTAAIVPRTGNYCLNLGSSNEMANTGSISTGTAIYFGLAFYVQGNGNGDLFITRDVANGDLIDLRYQGTKIIAQRNGTYLSSGTITVAQDVWNYLEGYISIDNTTGTVETKLNGVVDINFSGDTQPSSNTVIDSCEVVMAGVVTYIDDWVINSPAGSNNNTYPGNIRLYPIYPNAAGDITQLTQGGVTGSSNYGQVDDVPYRSADYVFSGQVDQYDLYGCQDVTLPVGAEIKNVIVNVAADLESGIGNVADMIKSGSTTSQGKDQSLSISARIKQECFPTDPDTAATWTNSGVNGIQIGQKIR